MAGSRSGLILINPEYAVKMRVVGDHQVIEIDPDAIVQMYGGTFEEFKRDGFRPDMAVWTVGGGKGILRPPEAGERIDSGDPIPSGIGLGAIGNNTTTNNANQRAPGSSVLGPTPDYSPRVVGQNQAHLDREYPNSAAAKAAIKASGTPYQVKIDGEIQNEATGQTIFMHSREDGTVFVGNAVDHPLFQDEGQGIGSMNQNAGRAPAFAPGNNTPTRSPAPSGPGTATAPRTTGATQTTMSPSHPSGVTQPANSAGNAAVGATTNARGAAGGGSGATGPMQIIDNDPNDPNSPSNPNNVAAASGNPAGAGGTNQPTGNITHSPGSGTNQTTDATGKVPGGGSSTTVVNPSGSNSNQAVKNDNSNSPDGKRFIKGVEFPVFGPTVGFTSEGQPIDAQGRTTGPKPKPPGGFTSIQHEAVWMAPKGVPVVEGDSNSGTDLYDGWGHKITNTQYTKLDPVYASVDALFGEADQQGYKQGLVVQMRDGTARTKMGFSPADHYAEQEDGSVVRTGD